MDAWGCSVDAWGCSVVLPLELGACTSERWQNCPSSVACTATSEGGMRPSRLSTALKTGTRSPACRYMICCRERAAAAATPSSGCTRARTRKHRPVRPSTTRLLGMLPASKRGSTLMAWL